MGKGGSSEVKETSQEHAAAEVAAKQWGVYNNELKQYENLFMDKVDDLNSESKYQGLAGDVNLGYAQEFGKARQHAADQLLAGNVDPTSGKFQSTLSDISSDQVVGQIDTTNRAQTSQADKYVAGLQDVVSIGAGQKADALQGYSDIANNSLKKATGEAQRSLSDRQALGSVVGAVGGAATRMYGLKDVETPKTAAATAPAKTSRTMGVYDPFNSTTWRK